MKGGMELACLHMYDDWEGLFAYIGKQFENFGYAK